MTTTSTPVPPTPFEWAVYCQRFTEYTGSDFGQIVWAEWGRYGYEAMANAVAHRLRTQDGQVARVGADAVVDEKGEPYFEVQLSAAAGQLKLHDKPLPVTPGMPVEVGILTGQRSVMQYLLKPVLRGVQGALQER